METALAIMIVVVACLLVIFITFCCICILQKLNKLERHLLEIEQNNAREKDKEGLDFIKQNLFSDLMNTNEPNTNLDSAMAKLLGLSYRPTSNEAYKTKNITQN